MYGEFSFYHTVYPWHKCSKLPEIVLDDERYELWRCILIMILGPQTRLFAYHPERIGGYRYPTKTESSGLRHSRSTELSARTIRYIIR